MDDYYDDDYYERPPKRKPSSFQTLICGCLITAVVCFIIGALVTTSHHTALTTNPPASLEKGMGWKLSELTEGEIFSGVPPQITHRDDGVAIRSWVFEDKEAAFVFYGPAHDIQMVCVFIMLGYENTRSSFQGEIDYGMIALCKIIGKATRGWANTLDTHVWVSRVIAKGENIKMDVGDYSIRYIVEPRVGGKIGKWRVARKGDRQIDW